MRPTVRRGGERADELGGPVVVAGRHGRADRLDGGADGDLHRVVEVGVNSLAQGLGLCE